MTWLGLGVVGLTAIVWSFTALSDLAHRVGVTAEILLPWPYGWALRVSWGLPITVDVLALVATRVWLRGAAPADAVRYARRAAWGAIVATIIGNAYHGLLAGSWRIDALIVSAVPAVVIGVIVHLAVLVGRPAVGPAANDGPAPANLLPVAPDLGAEPAYADQDPTDADRPPVEPPMSNEAIIAEARAWRRELGRPPSRDEMLARYRIGATRARTLRGILGWTDPLQSADRGSTATDREPVGVDRGLTVADREPVRADR